MKNLYKILAVSLITFSFQLATNNCNAQDIHFTMYDATPVLSNPATAGVFNGDFRGVLNYRSQWSNINGGYKTYSVNFDGGMFKNKWKNGYLGYGLSAYKDIAGTTNFGTTKINLTLSSVLYLDDKNSAAVGLSVDGDKTLSTQIV